MKTKVLLLFVICIAFAGFTNESSLKVKFNPQTYDLQLGDLKFAKGLKISDFVATYGEPSEKKTHASGEVTYFYENYGIVLAAQAEEVKFVGFTFNTDGDKKFAANSFKGEFMFGDLSLTTETKQTELQGVKTFKFVCPMPIMCAGEDRKAPLKVLVGFNEDKHTITQLAFMTN
jgi:hypothetical protein